MGRKLHVANLAYRVRDRDLQQLFAAHGTVTSAQVIMDRDTGRSKGFGFVEMANDQEAQAAIAALNGKEVDGRMLTVHEARPREKVAGAPPRKREGPARPKGPGGSRRDKVRKRPAALGRRLRKPRPESGKA